jgi:hypothetical protein
MEHRSHPRELNRRSCTRVAAALYRDQKMHRFKGSKMKLASLAALAVAISLAPGVALAKQGKKYVRSAQPSQIACTKYGCHPIPPGCTPTTQYDWWGNPTGYDRIVCR